ALAHAPFLDLAEPMASAYIQEANRTFFHPLGLSIAVRVDDDGLALAGMFDCRHDAAGIVYGDDGDGERPHERFRRAALVRNLRRRRAPRRIAECGFIIQPSGWTPGAGR
ncbi:MAG: hypothetical protein ACODAE_08085, partial [Gemmatimonadota bacterium]